MSNWRRNAVELPVQHNDGWRLESDWVLVYEAGEILVAKLVSYDDQDEPDLHWQEFGRNAYTCHPTHWQPLPEPPHA